MKKDEEVKEEEEAKKEGEAAEEAKPEAATEAPAGKSMKQSGLALRFANLVSADATTEAALTGETPAVAEGEAPKVEEAKVEAPEAKPATSKANKRTSIFGGFFEKVRSPTVEKKEPEIAPVVPPKDGEVPATEEAAKPAEGEAAAATEETPKVEGEAPVTPSAATATTPAKEKGGFFSKFGKKQEAKSPAAVEAPKAEEVKPVEGEAAAPVAEGEAPVTPAVVTPEPGKEKRRTSFFGGFGAKNNAEGETEGEKKRGLGGLFRNPSKAVKSNKEKKENSAPAKVDEEAENKPEEEVAAEEAVKDEETKKEDEEAKAAIGDVPAEAVAVGQSTTPAVQATA